MSVGLGGRHVVIVWIGLFVLSILRLGLLNGWGWV